MNADQTLIGSLLINPKLFWQCELDPEDLTDRFHREAFRAIGDLSREGKPVDMISVGERSGVNVRDLHEISSGTFPPSAALSAAESIRNRNRKRKFHGALQSALADLQDGKPIESIMAHITGEMKDKSQGETVTIHEALVSAVERAKSYRKGGAVVTTGLPFLDDWMKIKGGKLITIGGRPGTYKSAFILKILRGAAVNQMPVGLISLEMDAEEIADRFIKMGGVDADLANGYGAAKVEHAMGEYTDAPFFINHNCFQFDRIESQIVAWVERFKIRIVAIDYLQLVEGGDPKKQTYERIGEMTRRLKQLAMRLDIPIVILSQLNRKNEQEKRMPRLSDLRESGNIEQDSDVVMFTHCMKPEERKDYQIILAKQRGGPTGKVEIVIEPKTYRINQLQKAR